MALTKADNEAEMETKKENCHYKFIVIGGGIAGVTCAETLSSMCPDDEILLLTASPLIKAVTNFRKVTKMLEEFDVEERPMFDLHNTCPNIIIHHHKVTLLDGQQKYVEVDSGDKFTYSYICLCTGGAPKVIAAENPYTLGIRDTETVKVFQEKLHNARRVMVVGNGGIATELVYEIEGCDVVWAIKDSSITSTFIDAGAATFFLPVLKCNKPHRGGAKKRTKYKVEDDVTCQSSTSATPASGDDTHPPHHHTKNQSEDISQDQSENNSKLPQGSDSHVPLGSALGPDWHDGLLMRGTGQEDHHVHVEYNVEVDSLLSPDELRQSGLTPLTLQTSVSEASSHKEDWPVYVKLTNEKVYGCDFIVSATGVVPNVHPFVEQNQLSVCDEDEGINVNDRMQTSVPGVYAAGDVCHANWPKSPFWIQMRLWSQARQMGAYAAQCMVAEDNGEEISLDFCFEVFAHVTRFFNHKVVLLGRFNGQGLGTEQEMLLRVTKGEEYVKVILKEGHMQGALLIGDTDMEETFENLILNQMDLTVFKDNLLNPNIDIDDFFD